MSKFAISGYGRSGTMWLSNLMARDRNYVVKHEPNKALHHDHLKCRFANAPSNYGEVNSFLLPMLPYLPVEQIGVVLRKPYELVRSSVIKGHLLTSDLIEMINTALTLIDVAITYHGALPISFKEMTNSVPYTRFVLNHFGVDVPVTTKDLTRKLNASPDGARGPVEIAGHMGPLHWFSRKYSDML